ncbi:MAG: NADH-quinone oxidoreductase subunit NuoH [Deltaproteobacteria bacterium]|nr:NADH-quinone oxidoreductase subunit NuoH [Deltaproteobacteria bacterium]
MSELFTFIQGRWDPAVTYPQIVWPALVVAYGVFAVTFASLFAGITSWYERRVAGRMQCRIGPNRVGPQGVLQWLADGFKAFLKEDLVPKEADGILYRIAPYPVFVGVFCTWVILPYAPAVVGADLNVGVVFLMAITALVVAGIIMGGWASNSKWALLGGVRSAAQMVSYEIPVGFALLTAVIPAGTLSLQGIIAAQGGAPWNWMVFHSPATFIAFFVYFTAALAEGNRTPFDLPEAESELVAGYNTEYSGMRFIWFFFAEWANLYVIGAVVAAVFLGGWRLPGVGIEQQAASLWLQFAGACLFVLKALVLVNVIIWLRWTLPRLRVDQLMIMCWKYLVPAGMVLVVVAVFWVFVERGMPGFARWVAFLLCATGFFLVGLMFWRAWYNIKYGGDRLYLKFMV